MLSGNRVDHVHRFATRLGLAVLAASLAPDVRAQAAPTLFQPVPRSLLADVVAIDDSNPTIQDIGDVLQIALPASGLAATLFEKDGEGRRQWFISTGLTLGTVLLMKPLTGKRRPDDERRTAFPSGHSASAFAGASFLGQRYGPSVGIPAYALAGVVAASRIASDQHFADDVLAGASIAQLSTWLIVTPRDSDERPEAGDTDRRWSYTLSLGPTYRKTNIVAAPEGASGTDLVALVGSDDPSWTALAALAFRPAPGQEISLEVRPFEAANTGMLDSDVTFGGVPFTVAEPTRSLYSNITGRASYSFWRNLTSFLVTTGGVGLDVRGVSVELQQQGSVRATDVHVLPIVHAGLGVPITPWLDLDSDAVFPPWGIDRMIDFRASAGARIGSRWEVRVGYAHFRHRVDSDVLLNDLRYDFWHGTFRYSW